MPPMMPAVTPGLSICLNMGLSPYGFFLRRLMNGSARGWGNIGDSCGHIGFPRGVRRAPGKSAERSKHKRPTTLRALMAHAGFEPAISALRGRRPGPLDEWAVYDAGDSTSKRGNCQTLDAKWAACYNAYRQTQMTSLPVGTRVGSRPNCYWNVFRVAYCVTEHGIPNTCRDDDGYDKY